MKWILALMVSGNVWWNNHKREALLPEKSSINTVLNKDAPGHTYWKSSIISGVSLKHFNLEDEWFDTRSCSRILAELAWGRASIKNDASGHLSVVFLLATSCQVWAIRPHPSVRLADCPTVAAEVRTIRMC